MKIIDLATKKLKADDEDVTISFKLIVESNLKNEYADFEIKGLDSEGFEITSVIINDSIEDGETKTITERTDISIEDFEAIVEWKVNHC